MSERSSVAITLPICTDRHVWNTNLFAVGLDHPDIGNLKNRECIVFEIDAPFRGLFERVGKMRVWFDVKTGLASEPQLLAAGADRVLDRLEQVTGL